ncbi:RNA exonuclease 4 [Vitis vinifera]|uniref:RNA exonuclease 4 n=1 Tax=Vitis vinifera TaxID=29760 RepID=A0A438JIW2_VITVI|nr:RNA exonuclease 4 [Vitis vinifera]
MEFSESQRNKCAACYRQFNRLEHLVDHMRTSYHSVHEPTCGICKKHCRSFESLREHLIGPLPKVECARIFSVRGCNLCLDILGSPNALRAHRGTCQLSRGNTGALLSRMANLGIQDDLNSRTRGSKVVALGCKMVGVEPMARWIFAQGFASSMNMKTSSSILMSSPKFQSQTTGTRPEFLRDAMPVKQVQRKIQDFLCNGEPIWKIRSRGGKARILVGHGLDHDLDCLQMEYPTLMIRDTAKYPPLMKTSKLSNSLKYLTQAYLGYDIQTGIQDPYEDCVATMRLYMRMRSQSHKIEDYPLASDPQNRNNFASGRQSELERMTPDEMLEISRSDYYCWCLDTKEGS